MFSYGVLSQVVPHTKALSLDLRLKDGSIFKGEKVWENDSLIQMVLGTGDTITVHKSRLEKQKEFDYSHVLLFEKRRFHRIHGLFGHLSYGFRSYNTEITNKFDLILGKRVSSKLNLGAGFSFAQSDALVTSNTWVFNTFLTPYVYGRRYLNQRRFRLYADAKAGYSFSTRERNHTGGVYLEPGMGVLAASKGPVKWNIGLSLYYQPTSGQRMEPGPFNRPIEINYNLRYTRLLFNIGIEI